MDFIKCEPDSDGELSPTSLQTQNRLNDVKEDEDPLFIRSPLMKTENEVSCMTHYSTSGHFLWMHLQLVHCGQQGNLAKLLVWTLLPCCKNRPV
jgi:hypothetical protein